MDVGRQPANSHSLQITRNTNLKHSVTIIEHSRITLKGITLSLPHHRRPMPFDQVTQKCRAELWLCPPCAAFPPAGAGAGSHATAPFPGFALRTIQIVKTLNAGRSSEVPYSTLSSVWFHLAQNVSPDLSFSGFFRVFFQFKNISGLLLDLTHYRWETVFKQIYSSLSFAQYLVPYVKRFSPLRPSF